jgi:hypothetical protein
MRCEIQHMSMQSWMSSSTSPTSVKPIQIAFKNIAGIRFAYAHSQIIIVRAARATTAPKSHFRLPFQHQCYQIKRAVQIVEREHYAATRERVSRALIELSRALIASEHYAACRARGMQIGREQSIYEAYLEHHKDKGADEH